MGGEDGAAFIMIAFDGNQSAPSCFLGVGRYAMVKAAADGEGDC